MGVSAGLPHLGLTWMVDSGIFVAGMACSWDACALTQKDE
jgi:hypothetical protein